jgi:pimeloyl-ACP methyl ester carboxylesterase
MDVKGAKATALHCNPNLMTADERHTTMITLKNEGIQSVVFNYRNVGDSGGWFATMAGLLQDAEAVRRFIASSKAAGGLGVPNNQIILWGHSIGGAVAAHLAAVSSSRGVRLVVDRSFSSLGGFVSDAVLGRPSPALESWLELLTGWRFGVAAAGVWDRVKGKKVLLEHSRDEVIPPSLAPSAHLGSLANKTGSKTSVGGKPVVIELGKPSFDAHCRDLTQAEVRQVLKAVL